MFSSIKKIIAISLCVAMTLTNAGVSTFATSIERVATTAKQVDSNRRTIDYRFYEAFKYEKRTSYLMKDDESDSLKESTQQSEPSSGVGENTKTGDDVSPSFDVKNDDINDDKSRATSSDADDDSENDDENTTGNNIEEPEDDGTINKVSDDDTDTATVSDADDSSGSAATDEPEDDGATNKVSDDDTDTATTSNADTTADSNENDETESDDTTATTSDADATESLNLNDENDETENDDTTATTSDADVLNDDNKASDSDAKKLSLNLQPIMASDSESTLFGASDYILPKTWYDWTLAGTVKVYVQSITIEKYPTPAPTTYTHDYEITGSNGLHVYANVTGSGTSLRSDVTIYAPADKTIYAAEDSNGLFNGYIRITNLDLSLINTSKVTNMEGMFYSCHALTSLDLSSFNTSNVTNMRYMFYYCYTLTSLDLSSFNTSNVTSMEAMFYNCRALTSLDLSSFNTSNVTNMRYMFWNCRALTSLDLSSFNTSNVTNMEAMFDDCEALTSLDLSSFNTSNVTNMRYMFYDCRALTSLDLSSFNTSNVTSMEAMFHDCYALTSLDLSSFNTASVSNMGSMFQGCYNLTSLDLSSFNTSNVTDMGGMFVSCLALTSLDLSSFNTSNVTNMGSMFSGCRQLTSLDLSSFNTASVSNMRDMFHNCQALTSLDLSSFNTSNVTNMGSMFNSCTALTTIIASTSFVTTAVTSHTNMFSNCNLLVGGNGTRWADRNAADPTTASNKTYAKIDRVGDPGYFTESAYTLPNTWYDETLAGTAKAYVQSITIEKYPTPAPITYTHDYEITGSNGLHVYANVTGSGTSQRSDVTIYAPEDKTIYAAEDSSHLFYACTRITNLDLSLINTSKVTDMRYMFDNCQLLTSLDLSSFNTSKVTDMQSMFSYCQALTSLDLSSFNTASVSNMGGMFIDCRALTSLDLSSFNTSNVTDMNDMFGFCQALTSLDLSSFNTSKVTNMEDMFSYCQALTTIIASTSFVTTAVTSHTGMFDNCQVLVGGNGTRWADRRAADLTTATNKTYAKIDRVGDPGYFTESGSADYILPNTWYNETSAGIAKQYVRSITITKYPTSAPTTYTHHYTIAGSDGLEVYANVTGSGTSQRSDVTIYAPADKTIYAAEDSSGLFNGYNRITNLDLSLINTSKVTNMLAMFEYCQSLTTLDLSGFDTSNVTSMSGMFAACSSLTTLDVTHFDTSNVTSMNGMFAGCRSLTTLDVTYFDTSNVTSMYQMFSSCQSLTTLDVTHFDTSNVTNMSDMFSDCSSLTTLNVTHFNTSNVTRMDNMFSGCSSLTSLDVTHFNTSNVTSMYRMFSSCQSLTTLDVTNFDTRNVTDMSNMFGSFGITPMLTTIIASTSFVTTSVTHDTNMFNNCSVLVGGAGTTYANKYASNQTTATNKTFAWIDGRHGIDGYFTSREQYYGTGTDDGTRASSLRIISSPSKIDYIESEHFDPTGLVLGVEWSDGYTNTITYNSTTMRRFTFNPATTSELTLSDTNVVITYAGETVNLPINVTAGVADYVLPATWAETLDKTYAVQSITILKAPSVVPTGAVAHSATIPNSNGLKLYQISTTGPAGTAASDLIIYAPTNGTIYAPNDSSYLFSENVIGRPGHDLYLTSINNINYLDTSNVTNMSYMFSGCDNFTTLDVTNFDTRNVTDMSYMFSGCSSLTTLDVMHFNTSNVITMAGMFNSCSALTSLDLSSFNTASVSNMEYMFRDCLALTSLDLSSFNTSNVTNMGYMFRNCQSLTSLDLSSFNTSNVTNMSNMFSTCYTLTSLDLSSFNTSNVTNMSNMFSICFTLTSLDLSSFNTSNVTDMSNMFSACHTLTSLDLSSFNTSNVTNMVGMFGSCYSLTSLDLSSFNTSKVTNMEDMFSYCQALTTIIASTSFVTIAVTSHSDMFGNCQVLVGGNGTRWADRNAADPTTATNKTYAWIDGRNGLEGYFAAPGTKTLRRFVVKTAPTKTTYALNETFDPTGLVITAQYTDNTVEDITYAGNETSFSFSPVNMNSYSINNVVVTYRGKTANLGVTVSNNTLPNPDDSKTLSHITVKTYPQTLYTKGANFNPTGLVITAHYTDDSVADVDYASHNLEFSFDPTIIATSCDVVVTYKNKTTNIGVLVSNPDAPIIVPIPKDIDSITIKTLPNTLVYVVGGLFDPTGLEITVNYVDTSSVDVAYAGNEMSFSFTPIIINYNGNVILTYKGKTVNIPVTISNVAHLKGNGGQFTINVDQRVNELLHVMDYGESTAKFEIPDRTGYRFNGYYVGSEKIKATWSYITPYVVDVDARWLANNYKVKFDNNGGVGNLPVRIATYDETFRTPSTGVTKDGYQLSGWMHNGNFYAKNTNVSNLTSIHNDVVTLVASWSGLTYDIIYHGNGATGGNTANQLNLTYGIDHTLNANGFTKTDYTFNGWALSTNSTVAYGNGAIIVKEEDYRPVINLYARWIKTSSIAGTLTLQGNGGLINGVPTFVQSYMKDEPIAEASTFRRGYNFDHWSEAGTVVTYPSKWDYTVSAVTLDANWDNKTFQVRYVRNDSNFPYAEDISAAMNYGASYTPVTAGSLGWTKAKHTFSGWSYERDATTKDIDAGVSVVLDTDYVVAGYINLYPVWDGITYNITYSRFNPSNFALNRTENYTYGSNERIIAPATLSYVDALGDKYIFAGWTRNTTDTVAEFSSGIKADTIYDAYTTFPISIVGLWIKESDAIYLTFDAGEGNTIDGGDRVLTKVYSYGDTITYPTNVHKRGYLLGETTTGPNWRDAKNGNAFNEATVNFRDDKTVNACYRIGQYHLTYVSPQLGITGTTVDKNYDENFAIDDFTTERIAYTFAGWDIDANANVITYTAGQSVSGLGDVDEYVTLFTVWDERTYIIKYFDQNNNQFATANLKINDYSIIKSNPNIPVNAADKGYRYEGGISHTVKRFNAGQLVTLTDFEYSNTITEFNLYAEVELDFYGKEEYILAPGWYTIAGSLLQKDVSTITIDMYPNPAPSAYDQTWDIPASNGLKGYRTGTNIYIYAPKRGIIYTADNCRFLFSDIDFISKFAMAGGDITRMNLDNFFKGATTIDGLNLLDTSRTTNMQGAFAGLDSVETLNIESFETSHVTAMDYMFYYCNRLKTIFATNDFSTANLAPNTITFFFYTLNLTGGSSMFTNCNSLVGEKGTVYSSAHQESDYAHIDGGLGNPGYFTMVRYTFAPGWYVAASAGRNQNTITKIRFVRGAANEPTVFNKKWNIPRSGGLIGYTQGTEAIVYAPKDYEIWTAENSSRLFSGTTNTSRFTNLTTIENLELLNTEATINFSYMFYRCEQLTTFNLNGFDTSFAKEMQFMFDECESVVTLDLRSFDTARVENMSSMFSGCANLTTILATYDFVVDKVTYDSDMFADTTLLEGGAGTVWSSAHTDKEYARIDEGPTSTSPGYFKNTSFTFSPGWYMGSIPASNITKITFSKFPEPEPTYADTWTLPNSNGLKGYRQGTEVVVYANVDQMIYANKDSSYLFSDSTGNPNRLFTSLTTIASVSNVVTKNITNASYLFAGCENLTTVDIHSVETNKVTNIAGMFKDCKALTKIDLVNLVTSYTVTSGRTLTVVGNVTNMEKLFMGCTNLATISNIQTLVTNNAVNMSSMFEDCISLRSVDLSGFDTSKAVNLSKMFKNCSSFTTIDVMNFRADSCENMSEMFMNCSKVTELKLPNGFRTTEVIDMSGMFDGMSKVPLLNVSGFNTAKVTDMSRMFANCASLSTIFVSPVFKTNAVTSDTNMFGNSRNIVGGAGTTWESRYAINPATAIDKTHARVDGGPTSTSPGYFTNGLYVLSTHWYDSQFGKTDPGVSARGMHPQFITKIILSKWPEASPSSYDVTWDIPDSNGLVGYRSGTEVTIYAPKSDISSDIYTTEDASYIFSDFYDYMNNYVFTRLEKIENLNYLNIDNAKSVQGIFYRCNALKSVDLSNFDTRNVNDMSRMFYECQSLEKIDASTIDTSKVTNMERLFAGCQSLREINLGNLDISNVENIDGIFERCYVLPELDLTSFDASSVTSMKSAFESCSSLVTVYASDGMESASISPGGGDNAFTSAVNIRGGLGTAYTPVVVDQRYAKRDGSRYGGIPTPGYFTGGRHRVVLRANGGVYQNGKDTLEMIIHEEEMTARFEEPTRSGYTFANYKVGGSILTDLWEYIDRDTIYVDATWTPNNYRVVYNANGGEGIMPVDIATSGEIYTTRYNAFTRAGYEFDGWSYDGNTYLEDEEILTPLTYEKDGEVVLRAVWKGLEYKVYYHGNGATGGSMNTDTFTYGSNQTIKNNAFTRTNYEFNGWALSANGHVAYGNKANLTTHEPYVPEIHLYAKWIMTSAIKGTLVLDGNGGYINGVPRFTIKFTEYDIIPEVSKYKKGYVFTNWTENGVARDYPTKCNFTNLELTANWNYETYTIRYHANDGSGNYIDDVIPFGTYRPIKPSNTFNRFGYNFRYWSYKSKDDTKAYDAGFAPTEDLASKNGERIDLFAVWRGKDYTITLHNWEPIAGTDYVDSFVYGTGKNIAAISTTSYTSGITTYLFSGWATAAGGVVTYLDKNIADVIYDNTTSVASGNIDLYAIWIDKNDATYLTFDGNGGLVNGQKKVMMNLRRGSTIPFPNNNLKRFGYEKNGWLDQDKTTAFTDTTVTWTGNKIIYANWNPGTYTIKYIGLDADAGVTMTDEVKGFEETFDLTPNAYTRLGYNFVGWDTSEDADSVVYIDNEQNLSGIGDAGAVVRLYSVWEDNIYNLKFYDRNNVEVETRGLKYTGTQTIASNSNIQLGYKDAGYEYNDGANDVKFSTGQRVTVADFNINSTTTDIELFGQEEKETYIVAFDPNGGAINGSTSVKLSTASYLDKITVPTPIRNGYEFKNYKVVNSDVTCDTNNQIDYNWTENVTFTADWDPIVLVVESITITKNPKLEYIIGQVFDPSGLEIKAKYNDGTITPDIKYDEHKGDFTFDVSLEDPLDRLGNRVVTVTYKGAQKSFNISVRDWYADENVSSIKITKKPQTKYTVDDTLNPTGLEIEVTYTDGRSNRTVAYNTNRAMFAFNPNTTKKLQLSDKKVTVSFGGMKDSYDIVVEEIPVDEGVSEMKIIKPPAQVNYIAGQKLDPSGLVIEVTYSADSKNYKDGTKKQISYDEYVNKFSFNPNTDKALTLTDENVTVIFGGKTDTFGITVIEAVDLDKDVFSIKIKKVPNKVNYIVGEKLNPRGLVLEVTYSNNTNNLLTKLFGNNIKAGKTFFIDYNTFYNLFSFVPGITQPLNTNNKIVTLTFGGKEATFDITVSKNSNAYGPSNGGGGSGGGGGGGRLSGGLPVTEMNTVIETITLSSDYDWIYDEEGQREGVKLKKESSLAKSLMSSNDYKENYKDVGEEGYIQIQNGFYNLQYAGASFYFGFNSVGKMLTGFVKTKDDTEHYWVDDTKFTLTDIGKQDSAKYYLYDENGDYKGIIWNLPITIGNTLYTFDVSGKVLTETYVPNNDVVALSNTGWEYNPTDDSWKYYNTDSMGNRYYIRDEVKEITDRGVSHYYIFGEDEKMKTGLTEYKGKTYYLLESGDYKGAVYTGMLPLGGKVLTFDEQGVLVSDKKEVKALNTTQ